MAQRQPVPAYHPELSTLFLTEQTVR